MINKLKCWLFGHKRMKRVQEVVVTQGTTGTLYRCPRCGFEETRKPRKVAA